MEMRPPGSVLAHQHPEAREPAQLWPETFVGRLSILAHPYSFISSLLAFAFLLHHVVLTLSFRDINITSRSLPSDHSHSFKCSRSTSHAVFIASDHWRLEPRKKQSEHYQLIFIAICSRITLHGHRKRMGRLELIPGSAYHHEVFR